MPICPQRASVVARLLLNEVPENIEVGHMLQGNGPMGPVNVKVVEIKDDVVIIDGNHPLAGKKLIFDLEVMGIEPSTESN